MCTEFHLQVYVHTYIIAHIPQTTMCTTVQGETQILTLGAILSPLLSLMYASAIPVALSGAQTFPGDTVPSLLQQWQAVWTEAVSPSSLVPGGPPFGW